MLSAMACAVLISSALEITEMLIVSATSSQVVMDLIRVSLGCICVLHFAIGANFPELHRVVVVEGILAVCCYPCVACGLSIACAVCGSGN